MSAHIKAQWEIELNCKCPACGQEVDLLANDDFWDGRKFQAIEHGTALTTGVAVECPECLHYFFVDLEY